MTVHAVEKQALLDSLGNDVEFLKTIVGIFLTDCPAMLAAIRAAVAARDPVQIRSAAHELKGSVSFFGATYAVEAAQMLESLGRDEKLAEADEGLSVLEREMAVVVLSLKEIANEVA
ncbi:MAG TPA: Hpt domain-containing protein [Candidatus Saccharimonadales bacterium]|nr:Hpt domain-containing protein [Candidatus Saccharimonadales bacterium]